jgi:hypothetical protein
LNLAAICVLRLKRFSLGFRSRMRMRMETLVGFGLLAALASAWPARADVVSVEAATRFNTVCARCHEGECSGRLSFDLGDLAADNHIRRYGGDVSPEMRRDLYALLAYMKQACAYHPTAVPVPNDGRWTAELLAALRNPAANAYFVPLGRLVEGHYRATLRFAMPTRADAQIISESFEIADHPDLRAEHGIAELRFGVDAQALQYLRLRIDRPAVLVELTIAREPEPISRP